MSWQLQPIALPLLAGALSLGLVSVLALRARYPGRRTLIVLCAVLAVYDVGYALELGAATLEQVRLFLKLQYVGVPFIPSLVLFAAVLYTGARRLLTPLTGSLVLAIPVATALLAATNEGHELIWRSLHVETGGAFTRTFFERGAWYWVHNVYAYLQLGGAVLLIAGAFVQAEGLFRRQLLLLLVAMLVPVATHALYLMTPAFGGLDPNPYAQSVTGLLLAWGMLDSRLWDVVPVARATLVAQIQDGVVAIDQHGRVVELNPAAQALLPEVGSGWQGKPAEILFPAWGEALARARRGEPHREQVALSVAGRERVFDAAFTPLILSPDTRGVSILLHDVTAQRAFERLRESLTRTLANDLRNPLTSIQGALELLASDGPKDLDPKTREVIDLAREGSHRMTELVNAILDVERLKSGHLKLDRHPTDVAGLAAQAVRALAADAAARRQRLELHADADLPLVAVDVSLLSRVLRNLVDNAVRFTPQGGRVAVSVRESRTAPGVEVAVEDDGPGIPGDLQERLFGEFVTGARPESGTGLGLAYCRLAVQAHGGRIEVDSSGRGSTFRVVLPS